MHLFREPTTLAVVLRYRKRFVIVAAVVASILAFTVMLAATPKRYYARVLMEMRPQPGSCEGMPVKKPWD